MSSLKYIAIWVLFLLVQQRFTSTKAQLLLNFYGVACPQAEAVIRGVVANAVGTNPGIAAGLLRMHFHDCFVQGCDGSVLIDSTSGNQAEKDSPPNHTLRGFEVIDDAKSQLEQECPGVVSCADILTFATRDAVAQVGGPIWNVAGGRRDGRVSRASEAIANLPSPRFNLSQLTQTFASKGLLQDEMITLSGAHTIGVAHCSSFIGRLYNFSATTNTDPSLDHLFAQFLKSKCPFSSTNLNTIVSLDTLTPIAFDNAYYVGLASGKGLLSSDNALLKDSFTSTTVAINSMSGLSWIQKFPIAMQKLSNIEVKFGENGEIRHDCHAINP